MSPEIQELVDAYSAVRPALFPVLPAAILTLFGLLALLVDVFELGRTRGPAEDEEGTPIMAPYLAMVGTALGLGAVIWQALRLPVAGGEYFNGMIVLDGFGVFLSGVVLAGTLLTLLLTVGFCRRHDIHLAEYYHLILMAAVGMLVMTQAHNLIMIFVGLELMSVGVYVLTGFRRTRLRSVEAALKYFVLGAFSTGFFLYGIALVYGSAGTFDLAGIRDAVSMPPASPVLLAGIGLLIVGFGFKVALVPFHMWSPTYTKGRRRP